MATHINFDFDIRPEPTEPTGDPCERCEEIPYLFAWWWLLLIDGQEIRRHYLCGDCTDALRSDGDDSD